MDDRRFDRLILSLSRGISRRRILNAAGALAGGLFLRRRETLAQDDRDDTIDVEDTGPDDIPPCSTCLRGQRCVAGECCPEKQACDETCCPTETVVCTAPPVGRMGHNR